MDRNYDVITFLSIYLYLKRPRGAIFADIIKVITMFNKTVFADIIKVITMFNKTVLKDSKKLKKKLCIKMQSICVFLDIAKIVDFW